MFTTLNIVFFIISIIALVAFGFLLVSSFKRSVLWGLAVLLLPFATLFYGIKYWHEVKKPFLVYVGTNTLCLAAAVFVFVQVGGMQAIEMAGKINNGTMTEQDAAQFMMAAMGGMELMGAGGKQEMLTQMAANPNINGKDVQQFEQMFNQLEKVAANEEQPLDDGNMQTHAQGESLQLSMATDVSQAENAEDIEAKIAEIEAKMAMMMPVDTVEQEAENNSSASGLGYPMPDYVEPPFGGQTHVASKPVKKSTETISVSDAQHYVGNIISVTTHEGITRRAILIDVHPESLEFQRRAYGGAITFKVYNHQIDVLALK